MALKAALQGSEDLYFTEPGFAAGGVFHGFFGRSGGVSEGVYAGLNCGNGSNDDPAAVAENRRRVAEEAGCAAENLRTLYQVHGDVCVVSAGQKGVEADGHVTDQAGVALGVLTADCAPVLFYGEKDDGAPVIGAAHAGWGGAFKGVLGATVEQMKALGAREESLQAIIGPCIAQSSYEVGFDFADQFLKQDEANEVFFKSAQKDGHLMFDLAGYCALRLSQAGLKQVFIKDVDTYANADRFFSYRRTTHAGEPDYGRQISVIAIR